MLEIKLFEEFETVILKHQMWIDTICIILEDRCATIRANKGRRWEYNFIECQWTYFRYLTEFQNVTLKTSNIVKCQRQMSMSDINVKCQSTLFVLFLMIVVLIWEQRRRVGTILYNVSKYYDSFFSIFL